LKVFLDLPAVTALEMEQLILPLMLHSDWDTFSGDRNRFGNRQIRYKSEMLFDDYDACAVGRLAVGGLAQGLYLIILMPRL